MPRRPRSETPDGVIHVTARGNRRQPIYTDARDRREFERIVAEAAARFDVRVIACCQMRNHYHLLLRADREALSGAMHRINGVYAQRFNRRHRLDGHLFQDRFHGQPVTSEWHLYALLRYVLLNPIRAGVCASPEQWPWSTYAATIGLAPAPRYLDVAWVLDLFAPDPAVARTVFAAFVLHGLDAAARVVA